MLDSTIFDTMNNRSKEVKTDYLGLDVYLMKIKDISQETTKNGNPQIKVQIDSGFKNEAGTNRILNVFYNISGSFRDRQGNEKQQIDLFVGFLKQCFGIEVFDQTAINKTIGKTLAVATKRDENGYIAFWYAGAQTDFNKMRTNYKSKDESNGVRPERKNQSPGEPAPTKALEDDTFYDEKGNPVF